MRVRTGLSPATWALLVVLVLAIAGITHVASVLALPWRSGTDAFARVAAVVPAGGRAVLAAGAQGLPFSDPAMLTVACRFDLAAKPFRLRLSPLADRFLTIGFHARHGIAFYGLTVRAADATAFDLVLGRTPEDRAEGGTEQDTRKVGVMAPEAEGFVTISTPLGDGSERAEAEDRLGKAECRSDAAPAP